MALIQTPMPKKAVTIYHNPKCSTSRKVLDALRAREIEPEIVLYLENPLSAAKIKALLKLMGGVRPHDILRRKGPVYEELGLGDKTVTDAKLIALMAEHPILIERPIVETANAAVLCRPPERFEEVL